MARNIQSNQPYLRITDKDVLCVKIAGLCHDLGHGPFSHVFDSTFISEINVRRWEHEQGSCDMFDYLIDVNGIPYQDYGLDERDLIFIKEMIQGERIEGRDKNKNFLYEIVSNSKNGLDVDKMDYFMRDSYNCGIGITPQINRLIYSVRVCKDENNLYTICYPDKMIRSGELWQFFYTRFILHQKLYQHSGVKAIEYMICDILQLANDHIFISKDMICDSLTIKFVPQDQDIEFFKMNECIYHMEAYTNLNDTIIQFIRNSPDPNLFPSKQIIERLERRDLYTYINQIDVTNDVHGQNDSIATNILRRCDDVELTDIIINRYNIHCGLKDKDPVSRIKFYSLKDGRYYVSSKERKEDFPFLKEYIRIFCKDKSKKESLKEAFDLSIIDDSRPRYTNISDISDISDILISTEV